MRIFLEFTPEQGPCHRSRLGFAFRLFCAIFGHEPVMQTQHATNVDVSITYSSGPSTGSNFQNRLRLSGLYVPRSPRQPAPPPKPYRCDGENTVIFYLPEFGARPDWLAEIFEWVSCADEYSCQTRDSVGGVAFKDSYVGRHNLNARLPYAAISMKLLQLEICKLVTSAPEHPQSPIKSAGHLVINTHDVDFLPRSYFSCLYRLTKNILISSLVHKLPHLSLDQIKTTLRFATGGRNPLDQIMDLAARERDRSMGATFFFLPQSRHRRDGNYAIGDKSVANLMRLLKGEGFDIGMHGSYTSLDSMQGLQCECDLLRKHGFPPKGVRQHWLRFTLERLIPAVEQSTLLYDSSLGWSERVGFRAGACFAFPPYNFAEERAARFIEIPLILMEHALLHESSAETEWYKAAEDVLATSKRYGWGGISVLWHPTAFGGGQLPEELGNVFWHLADAGAQSGNTWIDAANFSEGIRQRYVEAGLLPGNAMQ